MRKTNKLAIITALILAPLFAGCKHAAQSGVPTTPPVTLEQRARDGIAAATGFLSSAQTQYHDQCAAAPTGAACVTIHKGVAAQNIAIDALKTYCAFGNGDSLDSICKPVANSADALKSALSNLSGIITDVKGLVK